MLNREIALTAILDRYGPLLTVENLADVLHLSPRSLRNNMCGKNALGLPRSRRIGKRQYFSAEDVAEWLLGKFAVAAEPAETPPGNAPEGYSKRGRPRKAPTECL